MTDILKVREREPKQGERFTEPKIGGLYPIAGVFVAGALVGAMAMLVIF